MTEIVSTYFKISLYFILLIIIEIKISFYADRCASSFLPKYFFIESFENKDCYLESDKSHKITVADKKKKPWNIPPLNWVKINFTWELCIWKHRKLLSKYARPPRSAPLGTKTVVGFFFPPATIE